MTDLPWDDDGTSTVRADAGNLHARATGLAVAAMIAASASTVPFEDTDYGRARADYDRRLAAMRADSARNHLAANNHRAATAATARDTRIAAHQARNAALAKAA